MKSFLNALAWAVVIALACCVQVTLLARMNLFGGRIDLPLVVALSLALVSRPSAGALAGFWSGLVLGALSGATLTHYALSRVLAGYFSGSMSKYEPEWRSGALLVALGSLIAGMILVILAPPPALGVALRDTILSAIYNGVVAVPIFALVRKLLRPKVV